MKTASCLCLIVLTLLVASRASGQDLPPIAQWQYWMREQGMGSCIIEPRSDSAPAAARIEYKGKQDWALAASASFPVKVGDVVELTGRLRVRGDGDAGLCFVTYDAGNKVVQWMAGFKPLKATADFEAARAKLVVGPGVASVRPRLVGNGSASVWLAEVKFANRPNVRASGAELPKELICQNAAISVSLDVAKLSFAVKDKRTGHTWSQAAPEFRLIATDASSAPGQITARLLDAQDERPVSLELKLDGEKPELLVSLSSSGEMSGQLQYPAPILPTKGQYLVLPMNEGISYPVEDPDIPLGQLVTYGGHGLCMSFYGVTDGSDGYMAIVQTPDDAAVKLGRSDGLAWAAPVWQSQKEQFGYTRQIRYVFQEQGGHVAMAKQYRQYAIEKGLLKTFEQKRKDRPGVDKLIGAVNVWCWDADPVSIVRQMQAAGIGRILWSSAQKPEQIRQLNEMGVLTSRYDIYQDLMDPSQFPRLAYKHPDWTEDGWPNDIILDKSGKWIHGWEIELKGSQERVPCGVLCDLKAPAYALKRIGGELPTHAYGCRFIDTTTASPWRECYSPDHPMTRTQSRQAKMQLLAVVSDHFKLVCGSETGHDAAVPYCDYFEGMLSLAPYRVSDAGRQMAKIYTEVPEKVGKFQVGYQYRLPLWELVYHDACAAHWYWGDYNNKLPAIWKKRDLFNALYGTAPMFMFDRKLWQQEKSRFVESYQASAPIARATGYSEMIDHRFLTPDRSVQQTVFANGVKVTVNFADAEYRGEGMTIAAQGVLVEGL